MKRIIILVVILIALLCALFLVFTYTTIHAPFAAPTQNFSMTTEQINENTAAYFITAQYPQFGIPAIDAQIKQTVETAADDIRTAAANPPDSAVLQNTFQGSFDKVYVGPDIISVELILSEYTGGAHGLTVFRGMNFDRSSGRVLSLTDALSLTGLSLPQVAAQANAQLQQQLGSGFQFTDGASATAENYSEFLVNEKNVTFIFEEYQVAAYAAGVQYVTIARKP